MTITVIICAYTADRWDDILEAIASVRAQQHPVLEIILVVDHNDELFERATAALPDTVVLKNQQARGLSGGRNTGIAAARGDLIAFLDDDAVADGAWLSCMSGHFIDPLVLGVGAKSNPLWLGARPHWFPDEFLWVVGCTHSGLEGGRVRNVMGGTMCVRRDVFDRTGGFAHWLGRTGSKLPISCEETEFCIRANQACAPGWFEYEPTAVIQHKIKAERLTFRYFLTRCWAEGISKARLMAGVGSPGDLSVERSYVIRVLGRGVAKGSVDTFVRRDSGGVLRAAAIFSGFAAATIGFAYARLSAVFVAPKSAVENRVKRAIASGPHRSV